MRAMVLSPGMRKFRESPKSIPSGLACPTYTLHFGDNDLRENQHSEIAIFQRSEEMFHVAYLTTINIFRFGFRKG